MAQSILAVLLPTEDLENGSLLALLEEILAESLISNVVAKRLSEPYVLWELITSIISSVSNSGTSHKLSLRKSNTHLETIASIPDLRPQQDASKCNLEPNTDPAVPVVRTSPPAPKSYLATSFWAVMNYGLLLYASIRAFVILIRSSSRLHSRYQNPALHLQQQHSAPRPIISMGAWKMVADLIDLDSNMPWLSGFFSLGHLVAVYGPGSVAQADGLLDR